MSNTILYHHSSSDPVTDPHCVTCSCIDPRISCSSPLQFQHCTSVSCISHTYSLLPRCLLWHTLSMLVPSSHHGAGPLCLVPLKRSSVSFSDNRTNLSWQTYLFGIIFNVVTSHSHVRTAPFHHSELHIPHTVQPTRLSQNKS